MTDEFNAQRINSAIAHLKAINRIERCEAKNMLETIFGTKPEPPGEPSESEKDGAEHRTPVSGLSREQNAILELCEAVENLLEKIDCKCVTVGDCNQAKNARERALALTVRS